MLRVLVTLLTILCYMGYQASALTCPSIFANVLMQTDNSKQCDDRNNNTSNRLFVLPTKLATNISNSSYEIKKNKS